MLPGVAKVARIFSQVMPLTSRAIGDALGVSHQVVSKAIRNGRIDPSKPLAQIRIDWEQNADPLQRARRMGAVSHDPVPAVAAQRPASRPAPAAVHQISDSDFGGQEPARLNGLSKFDLEIRDMVVRLRLRQVALKEKERALLPTKEIRPAWASLVLNAKSRLLQMGDELMDELACESDPIRCRQLIEDKVFEALNELSRYNPEQ